MPDIIEQNDRTRIGQMVGRADRTVGRPLDNGVF